MPLTLLTLLVVMATSAAAVQPAPGGFRDGRDGVERADQRNGEDRFDRGERGGRRGPMPAEPSPEEWASTVAFLADYSPHRLQMYEDFERRLIDFSGQADTPGRGERALSRVRARIHQRVDMLRALRDDSDPQRYDHALRQYAAEDVIMARLAVAVSAEQAGDHAAAEEARRIAKELGGEYVTAAIEERRRTLTLMRERLDQEARRIEEDAARQAELEDLLLERLQRSFGPSRRSGGGDGPTMMERTPDVENAS